jgi:hypothetical protein
MLFILGTFFLAVPAERVCLDTALQLTFLFQFSKEPALGARDIASQGAGELAD